ncbi:MAG: HAMP domain-containing protein [Candidatus Latescibacteria bacterium]|nr:HAMP domain-containing protein [Candidatus Latescibacterota bacterium]MBT5831222.1 HAMP domain-containing protein [Candidatus Latescibacterota bacterium]
MKNILKGMPIAVKIFALATSMLVLQAVLSYVTYDRINQVTQKLVDITDYLVPIGDAIVEANLETTERKIYMERIWRAYEKTSQNKEQLQQELDIWKNKGLLSDEAIDRAIQLSNKGIAHVSTPEDIVAFARLQPALENLKTGHQEHRELALEILHLLQRGDRPAAHLLEKELEKNSQTLQKHAQTILNDLEAFLGRSIQTSITHENQALQLSWILVGVATLVGIIFASIVTIGLVRPVKKLVVGTQAVEQGDLSVDIPISSHDETGELTGIFNNMVHGIRETQQLKATFGQYVDPRIVEGLIEQTSAVDEHPKKQVMTVFFSDVAGFSSISEKLTAEGLVKLINQYLTMASEPINQSHGVIDKFIGDAIVAFWGPPFTDEDNHATSACQAALAQAAQLRKLNHMMPDLMGIRQGLPPIQIRVGLATGELLMGNMGSEDSKSYTVMGNTTALAEQLESASKVYGTQILITEETKNLAEGFEVRELDTLLNEETGRPVRIYELLAEEGDLDVGVKGMCKVFEQGLHAYRNQQWDLAHTHFEHCVEQQNDAPSKVFLERVNTLRHTPPAEDWHGIWA